MGVSSAIERIQAQADNGIAYTGIDDNGNIIGIGGVTLLWEKVGSGWVLTSDLLPKYKIWTHRAIRDILEVAIETYGLHRVESIILRDHEVSQKWAERLGFGREGLLRKYDTAGNDYYLYARII